MKLQSLLWCYLIACSLEHQVVLAMPAMNPPGIPAPTSSQSHNSHSGPGLWPPGVDAGQSDNTDQGGNANQDGGTIQRRNTGDHLPQHMRAIRSIAEAHSGKGVAAGDAASGPSLVGRILAFPRQVADPVVQFVKGKIGSVQPLGHRDVVHGIKVDRVLKRADSEKVSAGHLEAFPK